MRPICTAAAIVCSLGCIAGCGPNPATDGPAVYPSAGPAPAAGVAWESPDGLQSLALIDNEMARVEGIPYFPGGGAACNPSEQLVVSGVGEYDTYDTATWTVVVVTVALDSDRDPGTTVGLTFYRQDSKPGWEVLNYVACGSFNDGNDVTLSMVDEP